jgi:threonine-phosphate decarboxylase
VTSGATEAIYLIAQAYRESHSAVLIPTFSEYEDACRINGHRISYIHSLDEIHIKEKTHVQMQCNYIN